MRKTAPCFRASAYELLFLKAYGNLYAVMKEILRREGMDVGTVRAPLPNLVASDMDTVVCAKQMIEEAVQKYVKA